MTRRTAQVILAAATVLAAATGCTTATEPTPQASSAAPSEQQRPDKQTLLQAQELPAGFRIENVTAMQQAVGDVIAANTDATYEPAECGPAASSSTSAIPTPNQTMGIATVTANSPSGANIYEVVAERPDDIKTIRANIEKCSTFKMRTNFANLANTETTIKRTILPAPTAVATTDAVIYEETSTTTGSGSTTTIIANTNVDEYSMTLKMTASPGGTTDRPAFDALLKTAVERVRAHQ